MRDNPFTRLFLLFTCPESIQTGIEALYDKYNVEVFGDEKLRAS